MEQIKLNLGCGKKHIEGYVNIDVDTECEPDLICNLLLGIPYADDTVDEVRAFDILEHISAPIFIIDEIWRVLKPGGKFEHFTPSTDGRGAFQDPTHVSFWNINSWLYYCEGPWSGMYGIKSRFKIQHLRDVITSNELRIIHTHGILVKEQPE